MPVTPIGALGRGLAAGAAASWVMDLFMEGASKLPVTGKLGKPDWQPPEEAQRDETPTQATGRRLVEGMMKRPLTDEQKRRLGYAVHLSFGAGWGGLYGLVRESFPAAKGPLAGLAFGTAVWGLGDYGIVPFFRLGASARQTPPGMLAFTWAAHGVYGLAAWATYESMRPRTWAAAGAALWAARLDRRARRNRWTASFRPAIRAAARRVADARRVARAVPGAVSTALH